MFAFVSQFKKGGPIIAVQVENGYGSFAKDESYMLFIKEVTWWLASLERHLNLTVKLTCTVQLQMVILFILKGFTVSRDQRAPAHIRQPQSTEAGGCGRRYIIILQTHTDTQTQN